MPPVLNTPGVWIAQDSAYASGSECARILNILELWICQGYTGFRICLNIPDCVGICLDMPEYAGICVNMPKSAWMTFFYISSFPHLFYNPLPTRTRGYLFKRCFLEDIELEKYASMDANIDELRSNCL